MAGSGEYVPKCILLTGGAGFIGSNVAINLVETMPDVRVVVFDKLDYCATVESLRSVWERPNFSFVRGDVCDANLVKYVLEQEKVDTIMHFAAQTHVDNSFGNSFEFTRTNVMGTHVLLEATKASAGTVRRFVHVSTDEVYGESERGSTDPFHEGSRMNPTNPYAATKACAELLAKSYVTSFGIPIVIVRCNNVYGRHQYPEKLIPKFIQLMERGRPLPIHGDGSTQRSFIHVSDVAAAYSVVLKLGRHGEVYNIGTAQERTVLQVARQLLVAYGREKEEDKYLKFVEDRAFNDFRYNITHTKLTELGWAGPKVDFDDGLKATVEWMRANPRHFRSVESALAAHPRFGEYSAPEVPSGLDGAAAADDE